MTTGNNGNIRDGHGFTHWWTMFNPRQLLVHTQLLKAVIMTVGSYDEITRESVLGAFSAVSAKSEFIQFLEPAT